MNRRPPYDPKEETPTTEIQRSVIEGLIRLAKRHGMLSVIMALACYSPLRDAVWPRKEEAVSIQQSPEMRRDVDALQAGINDLKNRVDELKDDLKDVKSDVRELNGALMNRKGGAENVATNSAWMTGEGLPLALPIQERNP